MGNWAAQYQQPYQNLYTLLGTLGSVPYGTTSTSQGYGQNTAKTDPGLLNTIGAYVGMASKLASTAAARSWGSHRPWHGATSDAAQPATYGSTTGFNDANQGLGINWAAGPKTLGEGSNENLDRNPGTIPDAGAAADTRRPVPPWGAASQGIFASC